MTPENPWQTLSQERLFENAFVVLEEDNVIDPAGRPTTFGVVRFKGRGIRILPVDDEAHTFLVGQWRYGAGYYSWELPAGNQEDGEDARTAAWRELREETGFAADGMVELFEVVNSGSVTDQRERSFLAWSLRQAPLEADAQERLRLRRLPFVEALDMALTGAIRDAGSVAALLGLRVKVDRGEAPADLLRILGAGR